MEGGQDMGTTGQGSGRTALLERADRYRVRAAAPVRDVRAELPDEAVAYEIRGKHLRLNPRLLSYWIPFVAGVGVMVGGIKTAGVPFIGIPQLVLGVALIAFASWDFVSDSGRLDVAPSARAPVTSPSSADETTVEAPRRRGRDDEKFRRHAVHMVRATGEPISDIARELDVDPITLAGWVREDRIERAKLGLDDAEVDLGRGVRPPGVEFGPAGSSVGMTDALPPEAPEADVAEQRLATDPFDDEPVIPSIEPEAPEADALEQALTLPPDDRDAELS